MNSRPFDKSVLELDPEAEVERIGSAVRNQVATILRRKGAVVGLSGGIDSSVVAALLARALGSERVVALLMPEADSADDSLRLGRLVADQLGVETVLENITPALEAAGCYARRNKCIREMVPEFGPGYKCKIVYPNVLDASGFRLHSIVVESPDGEVRNARLGAEAYRGIIAATNFKQRVRKMMEYHHADRLGFAVAGTPNRLEYDQGFFVKLGDGAADLKPIAHLYKTQVYQLGAHLDLPTEVVERPPTTDTFSLAQTQEEFYFSVPYGELDLCLYGLDHDLSAEVVAPAVGLTKEQVELVFADIRAKRRATKYLHTEPLLVDPVF